MAGRTGRWIESVRWRLGGLSGPPRIAFGVVNTRNQAVAMIADFLYRITEPALRPIRAVLPHLGGIDISPVILILIIYFIQEVIIRYVYPYVP